MTSSGSGSARAARSPATARPESSGRSTPLHESVPTGVAQRCRPTRVQVADPPLQEVEEITRKTFLQQVFFDVIGCVGRAPEPVGHEQKGFQ